MGMVVQRHDGLRPCATLYEEFLPASCASAAGILL
jgi:hypothetical protein